jgi:hypothetical protein
VAPPTPKSLIPSHLTDETSAADLKAQAQEAVADAPKPDEKRAMRDASYTFPFEYVDGAGRRYTGTFTHVIPDLGQRQAIGVLRAKFSGGVLYEALDPFTREINMMVADMTVTLEDKDRPEWAVDLRKLKDADVVYRLWEVVAEHEATFLGQRAPAT